MTEAVAQKYAADAASNQGELIDLTEEFRREQTANGRRIEDVVIHGEDSPEWQALLKREMTFSEGRSGKTNRFKPRTRSLEEWLHRTNDAGHARGFTHFEVTSEKDGKAVVLARLKNSTRFANNLDTHDAAGLDVDDGSPVAPVVEALEKEGWAALAYTTHSHLKRGVEFSRRKVLQDAGRDNDDSFVITDDEVRAYARKQAKYIDDVIDSMTVAEQIAENGTHVVVDTIPIPKFRVFVFFDSPVTKEQKGRNPDERNKTWRATVMALGARLGLNIDKAATDSARLFYAPRRHPERKGEMHLMRGRGVRWDEIKTEPETQARGAGKLCVSPSGENLNAWYNANSSRFEFATFLENVAPDKVRKAEAGKVTSECPFDEDHSNAGDPEDTACAVWDSSVAHEEVGVCSCRHDSCEERSQAEYLEKMLDDGWFTEDDLFDEDGLHLLEPGEEVTGTPGRQDADPETYFSECEAFTEITRGADVEKFMHQFAGKELDPADKNRMTDIIVERTRLGKRDVNKLWAKVDRVTKRMEAHRAKAEAGMDGIPEIDLSEGAFIAHSNMCAGIMADQGDDPSMFHGNGRIVEIEENENGDLVIESIEKDRFKARIEERVSFTGGGSGEAPLGIVNNVYHRPKKVYPPLHKIARAPVFDPEMRLITDEGYHPSGIFYRPQTGIDIPPVSLSPTREEVRAAVVNFADLVADFCLDAMPRVPFMEAVREGRPTPSFCHLLSVGITALCRAFIDGPTPFHLARKMKPRTGATKLMSSVSYIAALSYPKPQSLPSSKEEVQKTAVSIMDSGERFGYFDNLPDNKKVDFGEFAAVLTAFPYYTGRRLGVTGMVDAKAEQVWIGTGNKTVLSEELAPRFLLIELDPQVERPENRTGFKYQHDNHIKANVGQYHHDLLTIVQYWISQGAPEWAGLPQGGFERHSAIVGGILEAAGVKGFLDNREALKTSVNIASSEDEMMDALIERHHGTPERKDGTLFRAWGDEATPQTTGSGEDRAEHPLANYQVLSIKDILQSEGIALPHTRYAHTEDGDVIYTAKAKNPLSQRIAALKGTPREWGADRDEQPERQGRYILREAPSDKHSKLYRLEHISFGE